MSDIPPLLEKLKIRFADIAPDITLAFDEITLEIASEKLQEVCLTLKDEADFRFECLLDVCVVDYADYGISEWTTERSTLTGFERGVDESREQRMIPWSKPRFAVVYHLLSMTHNHRLRVRVFASGEPPQVPSVITIWPSANWYEREAFDLYGVIFAGHPDLRRLLTDYGFIGHPFRKDFPLTGHVEVRYDAQAGRVIYQPVTIPARTLVPKTIRNVKQEVASAIIPKKSE